MTYDWVRYWCSRDGGYQLDPNGFLLQLDFFKDALSFEQLATEPCLILLGEPGIGKTHAVRAAATQASGADSTDDVLFFDLRSYGSEDRLVTSLFENDKMVRWLAGDHRLHLFLDSLDECLLRIDTVGNILVEEFSREELPLHRLSLRVACRTADLPRSLENGLSALYSRRGLADRAGIYELCPLRREDVLTAATAEGIDAGVFLQEVVRRAVGTLAARPVTLKLLLNLFKQQGSLPGTAAALYESGCRLLCDESNESRRDSPLLRSGLSPDQTLMLAGRIAAFTILCNKAAIWKGVENGQNRPEDVLVRELVGGSETVQGIDIPLTDAAVRSVLQTGLFTALGADTQGWSHQTFSEFLAAWYLNKRQVPLDRLLSLISSAADGDNKPPPQLAEMLSWLASLRPDVRQHLLQTDPVLMLRSDVASFTEDFRAVLVDEILALFDQEKEYDDIELHRYYSRLKHPTIANQLRPFIRDKEKGWLVRRVATDIAQECDVRELQEDLVELVLDETDHVYTRINAGYAVWKTADTENRARLKPMALEGSPNDVDVELRGVALLSTWPDILTPDELFDAIVLPPQGFSGAYSIFLNRFLSFLDRPGLPRALLWVREKDAEMGSDFTLKRIMDEIMIKAWGFIDDAEILHALAATLVARLRNRSFRDVIDKSTIADTEGAELLEQAERRRRLLSAIAEFAQGDRREISAIGYSSVLCPRFDDLPWLLEQLESAEGDEQQWFFARLIGEFYGIYEFQPGKLEYSRVQETQPDAMALLYDAVKENTNVDQFFGPALAEVMLDSDQAALLKANYETAIARKKELEEMQHSVPLLEPPPSVRVANCLERIENGEINLFWALSRELTLRPDSQFYATWTASDVTKFPGWEAAEQPTRERIIDAAKRFVFDGTPNDEGWIDEDSYDSLAIAAYHALVLLQKTAPDFLSALPVNVWRTWAPIITVFPTFDYPQDDNTEKEIHQTLTALAYQNAPDVVLGSIRRRLELENRESNASFRLSDRFDRCWDEQFREGLRQLISGATLNEYQRRSLLSALLERGDRAAQEIAERPLHLFLAGERVEPKELETAAIILAQHANHGGWAEPFVRVLQNDREVGRGLVEAVYHYGSPAGHLSEEDAADLFIWLENEYRHEDDEQWTRGMMAGVSVRQEVERWRDGVLTNLRNRGTAGAVANLERIAFEFPQLEWMKRVIIDAKKTLRRNIWQPLDPEELFTLLDESEEGGSQIGAPPSFEITDDEIDDLPFNGKRVRDNPTLSELLKNYRDRADRFVFFIGAGLSRPLFPDWSQALDDLINRREQKIGSSDETAQLKAMVGKGQFLEVAEICASDLGDIDYPKYLIENFDRDFGPDNIPGAYAELLAMQPQAIFTTNYDRIPDVGGDGFYSIFSTSEIGEVQTAMMSGEPCVFKVHGTIKDPETIILTRRNYQDAYGSGLKGVLESVLRLEYVVFLGFSFADPYFVPILDNVFASSGQRLRGKFALLEGLSRMEVTGKEQSYGLRVVPYQKSANSHPEVLEFVRLLRIVTGQITKRTGFSKHIAVDVADAAHQIRANGDQQQFPPKQRL